MRPVDVDERGIPPRARALDQAFDERRVEARRHDDEVERERGGVALAGEETRSRRDAVGLGSREQLERAPPVALRLHPLHLDCGSAEDERRARGRGARAPKQGAGRTHLRRRTSAQRSRARRRARPRLLARRVLELLHHQPAAARGRAPVHLAQRLALDVLAHAVQVEARRPLQEQAPAAAGARARIGEEPLELDEARVDDEGGALAERQLAALESERILYDGAERSTG